MRKLKKILSLLLCLQLIITIREYQTYAEEPLNLEPVTPTTASSSAIVTPTTTSSSAIVTPTTTSSPAINTGTTTIDLGIEATVVNIVVPINISANINPNMEKSQGFTYGNCVIENKTTAAVKLYLNSFTEITNSFENVILPSELPIPFVWDKLNAENTAKYISFGIKPKDENGWKEPPVMQEYAWANHVDTPILCGIVNNEASVSFQFDCYYGRAFKEGKSCKFIAVFVAELE